MDPSIEKLVLKILILPSALISGWLLRDVIIAGTLLNKKTPMAICYIIITGLLLHFLSN